MAGRGGSHILGGAFVRSSDVYIISSQFLFGRGTLALEGSSFRLENKRSGGRLPRSKTHAYHGH